MRVHVLVVLPLIWSGLSASAFGQFDDESELRRYYGDEDTISIATSIRQPISKAPAVASVITAEDIRRMGATDIDDVLETVPGLHVARNQFFNPIYVFRGIYSNNNPQVLVLVNGISIGNIFQGDRGIAWSGMPVQAISRIEVIRGPGSAVYGADAFAGVINIITKTAEDIRSSEFGLRAGSFSTTEGWLVHGANWGKTDVAFTFEYLKTDGFDKIVEADAQTALDSLFGTNASKAPGPVNMERENYNIRLDLKRGQWGLRAGVQNSLHRGDYVGVAQAISGTNADKSLRWSTDITYNNPDSFEDVDLQAQLSYFHSDHKIVGNNEVYPPGANLGGGVFTDGVIGNPGASEYQVRFNTSAFFSSLPRHQYRVGLGYFYGNLYKVTHESNFGFDPIGKVFFPVGAIIDLSDTPLTYLREGDRKNYYGFGQYIGKIADDWELTLGLRYDHYDDFGGTTNPRAALVWSTTYKLTTKLLYGTAFRAPAFAETRAQNNPAVLGNPDLGPEKIRSIELVFDYQSNDNLRLSINLFNYTWNDIIDFYPIGNGAKLAQNNGKRDGRGFETEINWRLSDRLSLKSNFAYVDTEEIVAGVSNTTANVPGKQFYFRTDYSFIQNWHADFQFNWVMDRRREPTDTRPNIGDYLWADFALSYKKPGNSWEANLKLRNAFDEDAREPDPTESIPGDYPLAGRRLMGTLRLNF